MIENINEDIAEISPALTDDEPLQPVFTRAAYQWLFPISMTVVLLDQITKIIVRTQLPVGHTWMPIEWLRPYFRFYHIENRGAAFGIFQEGEAFFTFLAFVVGFLILFYYPQVERQDWPLRIAMGLQFGGAMGNLTDRLTNGPVTDFISVGNFAIFNVADASISIGVAVLFLGVWWIERQERRDKRENKELLVEEEALE